MAEEELKELTEKQKIFCHQYVIDYNASRSYKIAYPDTSEDAARSNSSRLIANDNIQAYIDKIKNDYEKECGITKIKQINELKKIAYSSIAHLHNTWIELTDFEKLTDDQKEAIESIDTKTETMNLDAAYIDVKYVKIKLHSKTKALDMLNTMLGYNDAVKVAHEGSIEVITGITFNEAKSKS